MNEDLQLGYLVLSSTEPARWAPFARDLLGLGVTEESDGTLRIRMDGLQQRFLVQAGDVDDLAAIGLLATTGSVLDGVVDRVRAHGTEVHEADPATCRERRVTRLVRFHDPDGVPVELGTGAFHDVEPFGSARAPGGFVTGSQGLGHAVFMVDDLDAALQFWTGVLGFAISDTSSHETPAGESRAAFLHCNRRHHSIALVQRPARSSYPKRLLHFMIQAVSMDAVGMAYDRALDAGLTINRSLGRHPNDRMFSFYATTPGGFDYEFGWGAVEVGESWAADHYDHISAWGHRKLADVR